MDKNLIELIRAANPATDVLREFLPDLRRSGDAYKGRCPFPEHADRKPSFAVYPERFICFGCDKRGDVFKFLELHNGWTFVQAAEFLARRAGISIEADANGHKKPSTAHKNGYFGHERRKPDPTATKTAKTPQIENLGPQEPPDLIAAAEVAGWTANRESVFFQFLAERADVPTAEKVAELYGLGALPDGRTVFPYTDAAGGVRTAKAVGFKRRLSPFPDCKRDGAPYYLHPKQHADGRPWNRVLCFFGERLLSLFPTLLVWIHESEKTALIASLSELCSGGALRHVHLATGGTGLLSPGDVRKWEPLRGRTVKLWPDADPTGEPLRQWTDGAATLRSRGFYVTVTDALQTSATADGIAGKIDFADVLLSEWDEPDPEPEPTADASGQPDPPTADATEAEPDPPTADAVAAEIDRIRKRLVFDLHRWRGGIMYSNGAHVAQSNFLEYITRRYWTDTAADAEFLDFLRALEKAIFGEGDGGPTCGA
jgi:hypothetical protein